MLRPPDDQSASRRAGIAFWLAAMAIPTAAVWSHPGFMTQDGPAHLYNAHILLRSFETDSPFREYFSLRWEPLPNWAGHLTTMGLAAILPERWADRAMTSLTLAGVAASIAWLRWRVAGWAGMARASLLSVLLAMNVTWLLGFGSFLLGASVFSVTLGGWWTRREAGFSGRRAGVLGGLVVLGYFCHLVSLGLTTLGLVVLEAFTPGRERRGRATATALGLVPLVPLGIMYRNIMKRGGGLAPEWKHLASPFSVRAWVEQLRWVDPISLARKDVMPLVAGFSAPWCGLAAPLLWLGMALGVALAATWKARRGEGGRVGWWVLSGLLFAGGVLGPDTLGASHGEYLQQRIVLLAFVALVPVLKLDTEGWVGRATVLGLVAAVGIQGAFVWDYAMTSERMAGAVLRSKERVGTKQRVATVLTGIKTKFRANPVLHADCVLGVGTGNIIWSNYETRFYYFPVYFQDGLGRPDAKELEAIALLENVEERAGRWERLLEKYKEAIDVALVYGTDPAIDAVNSRYFRDLGGEGAVRVLKKREVGR